MLNNFVEFQLWMKNGQWWIHHEKAKANYAYCTYYQCSALFCHIFVYFKRQVSKSFKLKFSAVEE